MANDCTDIDVVLRQINQRLRKLEKSDSEKTEEIGRLNRVINQKNVEIHNLKTELADPNSPLRNEECYIPFLEYAIKEGKIDEAYKERYSFQLRNALKNRVGTIANDFTYITREGTTGTLKSIKANYTLIYFNNPDCHDCKRVYNILAGDSPTLAHLVARGELAILALYPDESLTSWNKNKGIYPYNWIVARYARDIDRERYNIPAIPSTYLLDKNKKVIYKDAIIEAVESYLRHKYKL